jgi:hypothetical protein
MLHSHTETHSSVSISTHSHSSASLSIHVSSASELVSAQTIGKQDPFLQFSLDLDNKESFMRTFTHKNAGANATWNQSFTVSLNGEADLYVEILDEESTVNEVIGFCAIPINQVVHAPGANMNGLFDIYDTKGERAGQLNLQLAALGFPNSQPADPQAQPVRGQSYVNEAHCARMKSTKKKATGVAVAGGILGAGLAIGAGFLGKKLYDDHQQNQEEEAAQQAEAQRLKEEEEQKRNQEREQFEQERARLQQEKEEFEREKQNKNNNQGGECEPRQKEEKKEKKEKKECRRRNSNDSDEGRHHNRRNSNSSDEGRRHRRNSNSSDDEADAKKWNPVGTYAAGDRVKYHGNVYVCLQGHTSNPTWQPGAAHSLWQAE